MVTRRTAPSERFLFLVSSLTVHPLPPTPPTHRVKPAIFDLLLAVCIAAYLGMMYLAIQVSHCNAVGCSPLETRMALHKRVSEYLRILIDAAAKSVPFGLPSVIKPQSDVSIRVGSSLSRRFRTTTTTTTTCDGSAPRAGVQRDGNCSLTLQTFLTRQQVALRKKPL